MKRFSAPIIWLAGILLVALIVLFNAAVLMRYAFGQPIHFTEEVSGILLIWIVMIGAIDAERLNQHLAINVVTDLLREKPRLVLDFLTDVASVIVLLFVAWLGWKLANTVQFKLTGILRISWFWIDLAIPVGFVGVTLVMASRAVRSFQRLRLRDRA
ncbi:TRAP transporter small permease [Geminicoccus roseus]|uniref:TRAP transporter small permease n=1 Tax=Geminicoccus roseus TaxID=404900 RepID=UPI00040FE697|nr:TRAP transporter small permease [Geminicoccus roseus]